MFVEARDQGEVFAASFDKGFASANADFFKGFEAIGDKGGADNEEFFHATLGEFWEFVIGVGFEPWVAAEARLERDGIFFFRNASFLDESSDGFEALGAVTSCVRRAGSFAAGLCGQAVAAGGVGFAKVAFG